MTIDILKDKKVRVIVNTDAKNEVDDQFAIVHALLSPSFRVAGIIPAHFGAEKSAHSMEDSRQEVDLLLNMLHMKDAVRVENGAAHALSDETTPVDSAGARLIIEEAMKDDPAPLYIAFLGPLTDMASALLMRPEIAKRNICVIWIGGRDWPSGGWEYNLKNDVHAANVVFRSQVELWQVPRNVYRMMPVSLTELLVRVAPCGELGNYLAQNVIRFNNQPQVGPTEYRCLGDSPAIGLILFDDCGQWKWQPAPEFDDQMRYIHNGQYRPIRVYENIDSRFILEDFYAKLRLFTAQ
ncbi:MAG: nucleoside hydrolase [Clostridia bacterium]|nr:nucleoside hydrolase [Clostridia bacterium]